MVCSQPGSGSSSGVAATSTNTLSAIFSAANVTEWRRVVIASGYLRLSVAEEPTGHRQDVATGPEPAKRWSDVDREFYISGVGYS